MLNYHYLRKCDDCNNFAFNWGFGVLGFWGFGAIHQLLLPRWMSWKVFDGAVKVQTTRCHWERAGAACDAAGTGGQGQNHSYFLTSRKSAGLGQRHLSTGTAFSGVRMHYLKKIPHLRGDHLPRLSRDALARDCNLEGHIPHNQNLSIIAICQ